MKCVSADCLICNEKYWTVKQDKINKNCANFSRQIVQIFCQYFHIPPHLILNKEKPEMSPFCQNCQNMVYNLFFLHEQSQLILKEIDKIVQKITVIFLSKFKSKRRRNDDPQIETAGERRKFGKRRRMTQQIIYERYQPKIKLTALRNVESETGSELQNSNEEMSISTATESDFESTGNIIDDDLSPPVQSSEESPVNNDVIWTPDVTPAPVPPERVRVGIEPVENSEEAEVENKKERAQRSQEIRVVKLKGDKYKYRNCPYKKVAGGFKCGMCGVLRCAKYHMNLHINIKHLDKNKLNGEELPESQDDYVEDVKGNRWTFEFTSGMFKCCTCHHKTKSRQRMRHHIQSLHCPDDAPSSYNETAPLERNSRNRSQRSRTS